MQYKLKAVLLFALVPLLFVGCDSSLDGNLKDNIPPRTFLTVNSIDVSDESRLSSRVNISWWGDDPDGYIVGYEYAIDDTSAGNWSFTTATDSTFILPITPGQETDEVLFAVRAIDNEGAVDPVGASIEFPLRNTPPVTELIPLELPPDTTFTLASFGWNINDPDGLETILRTEIAFNDTTNGWTEIPIEAEAQENFFITIDIIDNGAAVSSADVYLGRNYRTTSIQVNGIILDDVNTFYVRTVDTALAESEVQEHEWYVKQQTSNILLLNDDASSNSQQNLDYHISKLAEAGLTVDVINITDGTGLQGGVVPLSNAFPRVINPTLNRALAKWDHIYWTSSSLNRNINYAQEILNRFFDEGGTLFYNALSTVRSQGDPLLNFLPIQQYVSINSSDGEVGFRIQDNYEVRPLDGGPQLSYQGGRNPNIWPFFASNEQDELYEAQLLKRFITGGAAVHDGPSTIAALNPEGNFIFFGLPLADFRQSDGSEDNVGDLLNELLINRLGFSQQ